MSALAPELDTTAERIAQVAGDLRATLTPLLNALAGTPPRPIRLTQGPGLDKSLASRLVQASRAPSDAEFLHIVPSPTGLRMLLDRSKVLADARLVTNAQGAVDRFQALIDGLPGGRQALDAHMGETSSAIRERREQMARQASFKAVSFLFGHYCETLTTSLFLVPSATPGMVDMLEIHRRIGLSRLAPSTSVPLLSVQVMPVSTGLGEEASRECRVATVDGDLQAREPSDYLMSEASTLPLPRVDVVTEGSLTTFILAPGPETGATARLTTAYRLLNADTVEQSAAYNAVRNYMLHTPCVTLVRDVFVADGLWPDAWPHVGFYLPSPSGTPVFTADPALPHFRKLNLTTRIEQLPRGAKAFELHGVPDQAQALEKVLRRAGIDVDALRGWRCQMSYPVPLVEMRLSFGYAGATAGGAITST